jgi:hypothetical protein
MATISNDGYADTHYIYGYRDGNARAVVEKYQRRVPDRQVLSIVHRTLPESGRFPQPRRERPLRLTN